MEQDKLNHEGLLALEQPLIKVPLEQLKRDFRGSQRIIEREMTGLLTLSQQLSNQSPEAQAQLISNQIQKLEALKRKVSESLVEERSAATRKRIMHLSQVCEIQSATSENYARWSKQRLGRVICDYLLRKGYIQTATKFASDSRIEDLVDIQLFIEAQKVSNSLRNHSCVDALQWCAENKSSLKKSKSLLEFNLRMQEYIEMVRIGNLSQAIIHVKKYLSQWQDTRMKDIQQCMALLAFNSNTECIMYRSLYDPARWNKLILEFHQEFTSLYSLTRRSALQMTLEAGLAALKTPQCASDTNPNCPVCTFPFNELAADLPMSHHVNSCLVCRITGKTMDANNPPIVLPNGYVYSAEAVDAMMKRDGVIRCVRSGQVFQPADTRKAFIS